MAQDPAYDWESEEILPREVVDAPLHPSANQGRIQKAGVVRGQDHPSFQRHPFGIIDAPPEVELVERPERVPANEIGNVHGAAAGSRESAPGFALRTSGFGHPFHLVSTL